jgi:hypothetical protein
MSAPAVRRVLRYEVSVDDQWHRIEYPGTVVHVDARNPRIVEFWTVDDPYWPVTNCREFRVHGTGHPIDHDGDWVGTAVTAGGALVWHLFVRTVPS